MCSLWGAVVSHRSRSKKRGRPRAEQPLLWVSVQTKLRKITGWLKPTKEVTCVHRPWEMPLRRCLHSWQSRQTPAVAFSMSTLLRRPSCAKTTLLDSSPTHFCEGFHDLSLHPSQHTQTFIFFFKLKVSPCSPSCSWVREPLCLSLLNCGGHRHIPLCPAYKVCVSEYAFSFRNAILRRVFCYFCKAVVDQFY